ncbi:unnamed protein product [Miscanthus lutarioriparius]|uniref:PB1 domain-containing protein n=1 Tax=Miscanthus lutarioriparius TaxID=422564 RepID=A0A811R8G7_9POAL|nr:unnamed protein product [Miscanthus lutarioriparius]
MRLSSSFGSVLPALPGSPEAVEEHKCLNSELWHACAGPLVSLPAVGSPVVYFPQGHSEQADAETDEVYAQMTLQPLNPQELKDLYLHAELGSANKQPTKYFCKTLTASDTRNISCGFSVPCRAARKVFPPLDFTQQPPCQELMAKDLHGNDNEWKFRHIFRGLLHNLLNTILNAGQPKRHLLTTGLSLNDNNQLLLGIRWANRPQTVMPSSVLCMHTGLLAAAAHAASTNSWFTIFYNPRASPSEFVIPLAKYMGTITGIGDLDSVRWPNSHWRSVKVVWDDSTAGERQPRVSQWEIEPLTTFPMYPSPSPLRLKRLRPTGLPSLHDTANPGLQSLNFGGFGMNPWMQPRLDASLLGLQPDMYQAMATAAFQDPTKQALPTMLQFQQQQNIVGRATPLLSSQIQGQSEFLKQQIQRSQSFNEQKPQLQPQQEQQESQQQQQSQCLQVPQHPQMQQQNMTNYQSPHVSSQMDQLDSTPASIPHSSALAPLPRRGCLVDQDVNSDPQNHLLFGVSIDSQSLLMQGGIPGLQNGNDSTAIPYSTSNFLSPSQNDFPLDHTLNSSGCLDDSGYVPPCSDNSDQVNRPPATFVKVYKSGTYGRSLDITRFNNYHELRWELGRLFGLEGQLEDPLRPGWQLVFVHREEDVLLMDDDPWQ